MSQGCSVVYAHIELLNTPSLNTGHSLLLLHMCPWLACVHHEPQLLSPAFTATHMSIASPWCHMSSGWNLGPCSFSSAQICPDFCQWSALCLCWQSAPLAAHSLSAGLNFHHWHPLLRTQWWQAPAVTVHMYVLQSQCNFFQNSNVISHRYV